MNPNECQFASLQSVAEKNVRMSWRLFMHHLKRPVIIYLRQSQDAIDNRYYRAVIDWFLGSRNNPYGKSVKNIQMQPLKAGDQVRVRSMEEIEATFDKWRKTKGCGFMDEQGAYCGSVQRVLKPMEQFYDEREMRLKKCKGLILLEGVMCKGTTLTGRCDRCCFTFWREEWLEKIILYSIILGDWLNFDLLLFI